MAGLSGHPRRIRSAQTGTAAAAGPLPTRPRLTEAVRVADAPAAPPVAARARYTAAAADGSRIAAMTCSAARSVASMSRRSIP